MQPWFTKNCLVKSQNQYFPPSCWKLANEEYLTKSFAPLEMIGTGPILGVPPDKEGLKFDKNGYKT